MQQIGRTTTPIMATWGSTFRTAGLSALQIAGIYRQVGSDPEETARALKESGHNATEVADALAESSTNESIIEILYEIGFSAAEVAQAALESLQMQFRQLLEVILSISDEQARALRVAAAAGSYGVSAGDVAAELNAMGVVITIIMTIVAVIVTIAALTVGLAGLAIPQLITVLAVVLGLGTLPDRIAEVLHEMQVPVDRAVAALLAHLPIDEATNAIREGYDASAETTATALAAAGEAWPDIIDAVFDTWDSFETTVDIVPADRVNAPDVMAVLFDVFAASIDETNRDKVFWLMKAGMTADNIAKGLRDSLGLDAGEIAELLVDAGMTSATAIANALLGGGFTQPLAVAQALADAGFTYDQVQAALMAAFTLTMQQIAQILGTVFGG
jgi:hypothetical protein